MRTWTKAAARVPASGTAARSWVAAPTRRARLGAVAAGAVAVALAAFEGPAAAGLGLLALSALGVAFRRPTLLAPFVALLLPAGEHVQVLGAQVSPLEAVLGGGAIGYLLRLASGRETLRLRLVDWTFAALVGFMAVSTVGPVDDSDRFREVLFWAALGIVFHVVTTHARGRRELRLLLVALAAATLVEASLALYEYVDRWSERFSALGGAIVYPLPTGTLVHPNGLAQFLVVAGLTVLALALTEREVPRMAGFLAFAASSLALLVTFSRASWIAFAAGVSVYLLHRRTRVPVLAAGIVAVLGATLLALLETGAIGARIASAFTTQAVDLYDFRFELIRRAGRIVAEHPLTGAGHFEEVGVYAGRPDLATHPHNLFLGLAVFFGIPAALSFAVLVFLALKGAWRGFRLGPAEQRLTALGFFAVLVALLVNGLFEYPFWNGTLSVLVVLVLAVAVTLEGPAADEATASEGN